MHINALILAIAKCELKISHDRIQYTKKKTDPT